MESKNLKLYEALKEKLGQGTALMLSEAFYRSDYATKADLQAFATKADLKAFETALRLEWKADLALVEAKLSRQIVQSMIPVWFGLLANFGATAALIVVVMLRT